MKMIYSIVLLFLSFGIFANPLTLIKDNESSYEIIVDSKSTKAEQFAAQELQLYIEKISGVKLPISNETNSAKRHIFIGNAAQYCNDFLTEYQKIQWKYDETLLQSFANGDIVLTGHEERGALYAVYSFLENKLGVTFLAHDAEYVPQKSSIELAEFNIRHTPTILIRNIYSSQWAGGIKEVVLQRSRRKVNSGKVAFAEYGGNNNQNINNIAHTVFEIIPKDYFESNPEFFALYEGRRVYGHHGQLCLTNVEMKKVLIENSLKLIEKSGKTYPIISISQMDNQAYCRCDKCSAMAKKLGSQSDLLIWFLNDVTTQINKKYPNAQVETLAYQYTITPPKTVKVHENIIVRLCLIEAATNVPLTHEKNRFFADCVRGWGDVTEKLAIWNYVTNFTNYGLIHPNFSAFKEDIQFFANHHVIDLFSQDSAAAGSAGYFPELRAFLLSNLAYDVNFNTEELQAKFLTQYYGAAGEYLQKYINHFQKIADSDNHLLDCYMMDTATWLTWEQLIAGEKYIDQAINAVKDNPEFLNRVKRIQAMQDWTTLWRRELSWMNKIIPQKPTISAQKIKLIRERNKKSMLEIPRTHGWKGFYLSMTIPYSNIQSLLDNQLNSSTIINNEVIVPVEAYEPNGKCKLLEDSYAKRPYAFRIQTNNHTWNLYVSLPAFMEPQEYEVFAEVRMPLANPKAKGVVALAGFYNYGTNFADKTVVKIDAKDLSNHEYRRVSLGRINFKYDYKIYFAGNDNPTAPEILLSRIFFKAVP